METSILDNYLSDAQLAAELGVCAKTLERWRAEGQGPPTTKLGRKILYRRASVAKWLEGQEQRRRNAQPRQAG
jgi:predicted site-specific integrase-resolvase